MESGMTPVGELAGMIERSASVDVRLALYRDKTTWLLGYGEVVMGADSPVPERTWTYGEDVFVERRLPGPLVAELVRGNPQQVVGLTVSASAVQDSCSFQRLAGQVRYNNAVLLWPRTEWQLSPLGQDSSRPRKVLVGDGPSFLHAEAALNAFFYEASVENGPRPTHMRWRIARADRRGWIHRVTIAPDALTVHVKGDELAGAQLELTTPANRQIRPVGTTRRVRFRLRHGLAPATLLMLRSSTDWLDFRYFPAAGPGGDDDSVVWDLPGADATVLIAGGESQYVEFKEQLPANEHKRKMLKTVAAFASGEGGTVLIGVTDDGQIAGVDATNLDDLLLALTSMIRGNIDPDPAVTVRPVPMDGKTVLLVEVPARAGWYAYNREKPEFYVRRGASTVPARLPEIADGFSQQQTLPFH